MALAGVKFDDGSGGFATKCFPVRPAFGRTSDDASGAWLIAQHAEQRRRFKAVICAKPRTYSRIKEERKKSELQGTRLESHKFAEDNRDEEDADDDGQILDGFYLMKHCCVDDPADLCSVNIANKELTDIKEDDLMLFENVAYVNAGENLLPFEAFRGFPALRELEIPLNGLRNLKIAHTEFTNLEMLDLSYNNLSQDDLLTLGLLTNLKVLHLTGNNFKTIPQDLAMPYLSREQQVRLQRFGRLEVLLLDDNKLMDVTVFAALAGLPKLRHLNMAKNEIFFVPQLKCVEGRVVTQDAKERPKRSRPKSSRKSGRRSKSRMDKEEANLVDLEIDRAAQKEESKEETEETTKEEVKPEDGEKKEEPGFETTGNEVSGDQALRDIMSEDFTSGDLSARIQELDVDPSLTVVTAPEATAPKMPPFPELRYLNLSDNQICEEDALLAVAAWPMLVELDIYNNPLTTEKSGDPPLLKRFLQERLGIKVNRMKNPEAAGLMKKSSRVEIRPKSQKITDVVPKVPKLTLEEKMTLELPPPPVPKAIEHGSSPILKATKKSLSLHTNKKSVLPPIPTTPKSELTQAWADKITEEDEDEYEEEEEEFDDEEREERRRAGMEREASDTFFMTQVDDVGARHDYHMKKEISFADEKKAKKTKSPEPQSHPPQPKADNRYKGYELLLDIEDLEDEPELPPSKDVQGNIRALKHTLNHMLVYRDPAVELNKVKKMVPEYRRVPVQPAKPHQSYQEKVENVLTKLKTRTVLEEEELVTVLNNKARFRREFPEAEDLLAQIQRRYNAVRVHSLKDAKRARDITENVLSMLPAPTSSQK